MDGFGDTLLLRDAVERWVIHIKGAYPVVKFESLRASGWDESWVPTAKLALSLWMGTAAASVLEEQHAIATMYNRERACIIKNVLADVSLSECEKVDLVSEC